MIYSSSPPTVAIARLPLDPRIHGSEGLPRTVVTDVAWVSLVQTILKYSRSVIFRISSVDGVDWTDSVAKSKLYVGNVIHDFNERLNEGPSNFKPIKNENVDRVVGSSAMMMSDRTCYSLSTQWRTRVHQSSSIMRAFVA